MQRIGSIWTKKKGKKETMTGVLNFGELPVVISRELRIGIFQNDKQEKDTHPSHYLILFPKDDN